MRKKILLMLFICICMLGMTACGTDPKDEEYNGHSFDELKQNAEALWNNLNSMDDATIDSILADQTAEMEAFKKLVTSWEEVRSEIGDYKKIGDLKIMESKGTLTTELTVEYSKRAIKVTLVYDTNAMVNPDITQSVKDVTVDQVYSLSEKMQKALLNMLMGMGTVFAMLILICLIISSFKLISKFEKKSTKVPTPVPTYQAPQTPVPTAEPEMDDLELVAVITAAIAASGTTKGQSSDGFVVRSIKRRR
jgi:sodium pump decarboxylase gamma subunit